LGNNKFSALLNYLHYSFRILFLVYFTFFLSFITEAQQPTKVKLIRANDLKYSRLLGEKVQRLIGNVQLKHDSTLLFCDSAYLHELTNSFQGFGNVHIKASDSLNIYSDLLNYDGNLKMAELINNVRLVETKATLYTDRLWYDRPGEIAYYLTGGKIVDSSNVLTSKKGYYYTTTNEAYFKNEVVLVNKKYTMNSDTLKYNTDSEIAWFYGPTTITSNENFIYCEKGWYDTKNDISQFEDNAYIITKEQILKGDHLFYNRKADQGRARNNVSIKDTVQDITIYGNYGEFRKTDGFAFVTDSAVAVLTDKKDSLYLHSDTLWIIFDSVQNVDYMLGYHHTKFFRKDLQGICDSLVYSFKDSTIFLFKEPILWSDKNQLTADTVRIAISNNQIDTLALVNSCFIISMDDTIHRNSFNQIKGRVMTGFFKQNELVQIIVNGNAESLFFVREENGDLIGINKTSSSDMKIYLTDNEVRVIAPIKHVEAQMLPNNDVPEDDRKMKGFKWMEDRRPVKKSDIFIWK
jgi:lipopolysaccharide export system protein LptA